MGSPYRARNGLRFQDLTGFLYGFPFKEAILRVATGVPAKAEWV